MIARVIGGESVLVPIRGRVGDLDSVFTLSEVGSHIWGLLETPRTMQEIAEAVSDQYEVTPEQALEDARGFVEQLADAGLLLQRETPVSD